MDSSIAQGFVGGLLAGLPTGIGALGVCSVRELSRRANDVLLSAAAGIVLAATFVSLLGPGIEAALAGSAGRAGASLAGGLRPFALAFAGGAMIFVIASEIISEIAREETKQATPFALLAGLVVITTLDIALG
jgi:zinc transporter ZupT